MTLPRFETNFRERTRQAWTAFDEIEAELRAIMDADKLRERGEELMEKLSQALEPAFSSPAFEIGFNGEKYELILSAEGNRSALFPLVYFQKHAPKEVLAHWNILVGRQSQGDFSLRTGGMEVKPEQVMRILCDNAVKYSPKGSTITLGVQKTENGCTLSMSDHGPGIPKPAQLTFPESIGSLSAP